MSLLRNKGFVKLIPVVVVIALAVAFAFVLYFLQYGEHFKIVYVVKSSEADRHVINMAQVLMAYPKLVKNDSYVTVKGMSMTRTHRALMHEEKLDAQMVNKAYFEKYRTLIKETDLAKDVNYPDTAYVIVVEDLERNRVWALVGMGLIVTKDLEPEALDEKTMEIRSLYICLSVPTDPRILDSPGRFWDAFNLWANNCEASSRLRLKMMQKSFPVAIATNGDVTMGRLTIRMTEW